MGGHRGRESAADVSEGALGDDAVEEMAAVRMSAPIFGKQQARKPVFLEDFVVNFRADEPP